MARKPLINIHETDSGNGVNAGASPPAYHMLLSGNMIPVKERVVRAVLQKRNVPILMISLDDKSAYMSPVNKTPDYSLGSNQGYDLFSSMSIREACEFLQNAVHGKQNGDDQSVQIIRYLNFIEKLNGYLKLNLPTIRDINNHFYQPDVIGNALTEMYQTGKISPKEFEQLNVSLIRGIKGQLIIDDILVSVDYNLHFEESSGISVNDLKDGQIAYLDLSVRNNSYTERQKRDNILYSVKNYTKPFVLLLNVGADDYHLVSEFISTMTARTSCQFVVMMDDVFAQVPDYDTFRKEFSLNLLGQHTGQSCTKMSECFHEVYRQETHYASTVNRRMFSESFIDILFDRNHTDTTTSVPVKRRIIEEERIIALTGNSFILMDNTGVTNYFSIYSI